MIALWRKGRLILALLVLPLVLSHAHPGLAQQTQPQETAPIVGYIEDSQGQPVAGAVVSALSATDGSKIADTESQEDGNYALSLPLQEPLPNSLVVHIERPHFDSAEHQVDAAQMDSLRSQNPIEMPDTVLTRRITPAFWVATIIFVAVLILIALGQLHNTLAALVGASLIFAVSYLGALINPDLFIFGFELGLSYIDWNVIFLILGMMIVIAVVERTGVFQWSAFMAYRLSRGRLWLLAIILMLITGVASAFLDNVTTMLLMTPITIQIALSLGINPLALLIPEVMASNVVGVSTLVGTPTNILIGSFANISFNDFLVNLTPGVLMALVGLIIYSQIVYRRDLATPGTEGISATLLQRLAERGRITQPGHLRKAAVVGAGMVILFVFGERVHLQPAVTAIMGATALLVWIKPDIEEMIEAVDWTTLVFFMGLFITVGAVQEVGLISFIAQGIGDWVGENLALTMVAVTGLSAILSTVVANIPFTAAMLPVVGFLSATVPGANSKVLFYCLSVGSAMGGNGSLIGASANMVTAGIADRAGSTISYVYFLKKGMPALVITVSLALIWLFIRFH